MRTAANTCSTPDAVDAKAVDDNAHNAPGVRPKRGRFPFAGGTKRFYRMVQKLVGVRAAHAVQDLGFHDYFRRLPIIATCAASGVHSEA